MKPPVVRLALALALSILGTRVSAAEEQPREPGVTIERSMGTVRLEAVLPGRLVSYALPRHPDGHRDVLLLVEPATQSEPPEEDREDPSPCEAVETPETPSPPPRLLIRLDHRDRGALQILRDDLPSDAGVLLALETRDGETEELLLGRPGELSRLEGWNDTDSPVERPVLADAALDPAALRSLTGRSPSELRSHRLMVPVLGGVRFYERSPDDRGWIPLSDISLPLVASQDGPVLRLEGPLVEIVGRRADGSLLYASGPEPYGHRRLRTILIDPAAGADHGRLTVWSRLPGPERVLESAYRMVNGRPALLVTTRSALKLSFFGEKLLRLYYLDEPDRSRIGAEASLAFETRINLWQRTVPVFLDADRDGYQDLVLGYWKGLSKYHLVLDTYLGQADGSFSRKPRSTGLEFEDADRSVLGFGSDLDGDGLADLLLRVDGEMRIFRGSSGSRGGKHLVEEEARWSVPIPDTSYHHSGVEISLGEERLDVTSLPSAFGSILVIDMDGDGRPEILAPPSPDETRGVLYLVSLTP